MHLRVAIILASLIALPSASNQATPPQSQASGFVNTLMPQPSQLSAQEGRLTLTPSFAATADHYRDARLDAAIARSLDRLKTQTGISIPASPPGAGTSGAHVLNEVVQNNVVGIFLANNNAGNQTVIQQNLIQNNNQPGAASGSGRSV